MSRSFGLTFALVIVAALVSGEAAAQAKKKLTVANGADVAFLHYFAAVKKGFFEKNGIQVDSKLFDDGVTALDSLLTGNADISAASEMRECMRVSEHGSGQHRTPLPEPPSVPGRLQAVAPLPAGASCVTSGAIR